LPVNYINSKTALLLKKLYKKKTGPVQNGQCEKVVNSKGAVKKWL